MLHGNARHVSASLKSPHFRGLLSFTDTKRNSMSIFTVGKNKFAIGTYGKRAEYVVKMSGKKITGVRGQRPLLNKRHNKVAATAALKAAFKAALA